MIELAPSLATEPGVIAVTNSFDGSEVGTVANLGAGAVPALMERAKAGARVSRDLSRHARARRGGARRDVRLNASRGSRLRARRMALWH